MKLLLPFILLTAVLADSTPEDYSSSSASTSSTEPSSHSGISSSHIEDHKKEPKSVTISTNISAKSAKKAFKEVSPFLKSILAKSIHESRKYKSDHLNEQHLGDSVHGSGLCVGGCEHVSSSNSAHRIVKRRTTTTHTVVHTNN